MTHPFPTRRSSDLPLAQAPLDQRQGRCGAGGLVRQLPQGFPIASDRAQPSPGTDDGVVFRLSPPPVLGLQERFQPVRMRSEEHTSELQSLMRISYAVFCLKKKNSYI